MGQTTHDFNVQFMYILGMFITIERVFEYETDVEYAPALSIILERVYVFDTVIMHANLMALRIMDLNLCQISYRIRPMASETEIKGPKMQYEKLPPTQTQTHTPVQIETNPLFNSL